MPRENLKVVTELYAALQHKDTVAMAALSSPEISVRQSQELPWGGAYTGITDAMQFFGKVSSFLDSSVSIERMIDAGEYVAVVGRTSGTVKTTRQKFDAPLVHLWQVREGKILSLAVFLDHPAILPQLQARLLPAGRVSCQENDGRTRKVSICGGEVRGVRRWSR